MHQITGATTVTINTDETYNLVPADGNAYVWVVSGGTISSGQGTPTIVVHWTTVGADSVQCTVTGGGGDDVVVIDIEAG